MVTNANPLNNPGADHRSDGANERLYELGFEVEQARDFIYEHMTSLDFLFQIFSDYSIDTDMIAEIMDLEDVSGTEVANFFASHGLDSTPLGGSSPTIEIMENHDEEDNYEDQYDDDGEEDHDDGEYDDDTHGDDEYDHTNEDTVDIVYDGVYSGTISTNSELLSFEGILETTVSDDELIATWSAESLGVSGTLYGTIDNETGEYTLTDLDSEESYGLVITGTTSYENSTGTWSAGFFSGEVETTFIG